jgi:predicted RNA-binding Zn-ribbon protein involved in translation (DUF1610 family)
MEECPICGEELFGSTTRLGGWRMCAKHRVHVKPSQYAGRCSACLGRFAVGEEVLMFKDDDGGKWVILHRRDACRGAPQSAPPRASSGGRLDKYWNTLHLVPGAPPEIIRAVYRELSKKHHPDKGGDIRKMQEINAAVEMVTK